jgi:hypothetical protein
MTRSQKPVRLCSLCGEPRHARGFCVHHYSLSRRGTRQPSTKPCETEGCPKPHHAHGLCRSCIYFLNKKPKNRTRYPELLVEYRELLGWGETKASAAERLGVSTRTIERALRSERDSASIVV